MKATLVFLFMLCVPIYLVYCKKCTETGRCGKGHACVRSDGMLNCEPFAHKGKPCSSGDPLQTERQIYESYPPCHADKGLQCGFKNGKNICVKQEGGLVSKVVSQVK